MFEWCPFCGKESCPGAYPGGVCENPPKPRKQEPLFLDDPRVDEEEDVAYLRYFHNI